ncbi:hypothetical protein [Paenibacillus sp. L3-i20]|uniref:hypothetical protein n=1 Tax=Paenibacillus sp. L3-i20 TaxID=2905833 RepID=UPI001EDE0C3F|nr:hypothetical protein [Paenibacillus sp. L3-i20]GKU79306.1 hypothetical protein L3i20_v237030 [Paenibacillus sp. L3-i20]
MIDKRMEEVAQQIEGLIISQMNKGIPGPYLPREFSEVERAFLIKITRDKLPRTSFVRKGLAWAYET